MTKEIGDLVTVPGGKRLGKAVNMKLTMAQKINRNSEYGNLRPLPEEVQRKLARRAQARLEEVVTGTAVGGQIETKFDADTLASMMKLVEMIPPVPFIGSSEHFEDNGKAVQFEHDGRDYLGAHPNFWKLIPKGSFGKFSDPISMPQVIDLDLHPGMKADFFGAMAKVTMGETT